MAKNPFTTGFFYVTIRCNFGHIIFKTEWESGQTIGMTGLTEGGGAMYEQFKMRATGVGAEVHRFATKAETAEFLLGFLKDEGLADAAGCYALCADELLGQTVEPSRLQAFAGLKFEVSRELSAQARFGISRMSWALADTGSLVQDQSAVAQRLVSSLPTIHIALASPDRILTGKRALFERIDPRVSRYLAFVTGPSRTADIERVLTIGVHGPQRLVIVFVDELGGE
jgi:L-lactate dehydrogenase complex protein LldG